MRQQIIEAGQMIAADLLMLEGQIDETIASGGRLPMTMMAARAHAKLPASVDQEALRHAAKAFELMVQARQHVVQAHARYAEVQKELGMESVAFGDQYLCPGESGSAPSEPAIRLAASRG
ncbi:hypothetical protein [Sphingomonas sp. KR3-1]|uniref:hypothetical protein n=1 Tax=Sphingomonas sp. KR3-1 TaxID=3156611 RepID=UPI0032B328BE